MSTTSDNVSPRQIQRVSLPRKELVLPPTLTPEQRGDIYEMIETLMLRTGAKERLKRSAKSNISAFKANVNKMLIKVNLDLQPGLIETIDDLIRFTEVELSKFLMEFGDLILEKQRVEAQLRVFKMEHSAVNNLRQEDSDRYRKALDFIDEYATKTLKKHQEELSRTTNVRKAEQELRKSISQAYGLAQTVSFLNHRKVKAEILKVLGKYV